MCPSSLVRAVLTWRPRPTLPCGQPPADTPGLLLGAGQWCPVRPRGWRQPARAQDRDGAAHMVPSGVRRLRTSLTSPFVLDTPGVADVPGEVLTAFCRHVRPRWGVVGVAQDVGISSPTAPPFEQGSRAPDDVAVLSSCGAVACSREVCSTASRRSEARTLATILSPPAWPLRRICHRAAPADPSHIWAAAAGRPGCLRRSRAASPNHSSSRTCRPWRSDQRQDPSGSW